MKLNQSLFFGLGIYAFVNTSVSAAEFIACPIEKELGCTSDSSGIHCRPLSDSFSEGGTTFVASSSSLKLKKAVSDANDRQCEYDCGSDCLVVIGFRGSDKSGPEKCTPVNEGSKIGFECP